MVRAAAGVLGLAALVVTGPAIAGGDPGPITLAWEGLPGCPGEREVRSEIERVLGGPADPASRRYLRAEARVSRAGAGFHVHIVTDLGGAIGERDLDGPTCAAVANAAAVIVALTFDPEALKRRADPAAQAAALLPDARRLDQRARRRPCRRSRAPRIHPRARHSPPPLPDPSVPPEPFRAFAPASPERVASTLHRPVFAVGGFGSASIGAVPGVGGGVGGGVAVIVGRLRADLSAAYWPARPATLPATPTKGAEVHLVAGDGRACWALLRAPVELSPCLGIELGSMAATGFGVRSDGNGSALWVAPLAEAEAAVPLGRHFAARLDVGALVPVHRPPFVLLGAGTVYVAGPVAGRATLGVEVRF